MMIGKAGLAWVERIPTVKRTITLDGPGHMLRECGDWKTSMIIPPVPAGEVEYDQVEIRAAILKGEDLTWERAGPNLCRIVRMPASSPSSGGR